VTNVAAIDSTELRLKRLPGAVEQLGKPEWRPMLGYVANLHECSIHPPRFPFTRAWEEIGPGYQNSPAFGHWDIVHAILDVLEVEPEHARMQIENILDMQNPDGFMPAAIWMKWSEPDWSLTQTHPPVWPVAVDDYYRKCGSTDILERAFDAISLQIGWFERNRHAGKGGFFYNDILTREWESGVDEGVRFDHAQTGPFACVDATSHAYLLYHYAAEWAAVMGAEADRFATRLDEIRSFIQTELFDDDTGFFYDVWSCRRPEARRAALEGMWPMVVGAGTPEQCRRVVHDNLLNESQFFAPHPLTTVGLTDPAFELRMWRGPSWNSMTYWAARGCLARGMRGAARAIVERALDSTASVFDRTGTIWEFYDPQGGDPRELLRKPDTTYNTPCSDYLGHNPVAAMARLWTESGTPD